MLQRILCLIVLISLTAGCGLLPDKIDETREWSAQKLYTQARDALQSKNYEQAIDLYEKLEARHPFGRYAQQALLASAYAYYKFDEPDSAIATLDRCIKTYPRHPHLDYAYYLKGLANFNRGKNIIDRILPQDESERDPGAARDSFFDFQELVRRFPDSRYAEDATLRMRHLRNNLAQHEVNVADYYMRRGAYIAAVNRAERVIKNFQNTPAVPAALEIMVRGYRRLGLDELAADSLRIYRLNYPERAAKL